MYSILGEVGHEDNGGLGVVLAHGFGGFHTVDSRKLDVEEDEIVMRLVAAGKVECADLTGNGALDARLSSIAVDMALERLCGLVAVLDDKNPMHLAPVLCRLR